MEYFTNLQISIEPDAWLAPPVKDMFSWCTKNLAWRISTHSPWKHYKHYKTMKLCSTPATDTQKLISLHKIIIINVKSFMPNLKKCLASLNGNQHISKNTLSKVLSHLCIALFAFRKCHFDMHSSSYCSLFLSLETQPAMHMHISCISISSSWRGWRRTKCSLWSDSHNFQLLF